jgi:hypothetical protein
LYGNAKESMDDNLPLLQVFGFLKKINPKWYFPNQSSHVDFKWAWFPCDIRGNITCTRLWIGHGGSPFSHLTCFST